MRWRRTPLRAAHHPGNKGSSLRPCSPPPPAPRVCQPGWRNWNCLLQDSGQVLRCPLSWSHLEVCLEGTGDICNIGIAMWVCPRPRGLHRMGREGGLLSCSKGFAESWRGSQGGGFSRENGLFSWTKALVTWAFVKAQAGRSWVQGLPRLQNEFKASLDSLDQWFSTCELQPLWGSSLWPFHRSHRRPSKSTDIYIMFYNRGKIAVMK